MEGKTGGWEKIRNLGAGGFGVVSLWQNSYTKEIIALKNCRNDGNDLASRKKIKENWCKEVSKMKQLKHKNIIKVLDLPSSFSKKSELPILCMEFCSRGDLRKELCRVENICGLPEENVRAILSDVKDGIEYLHSKKITHRDLKPENIVLQEVPNGPNGTKIVYKLIDLGFAKEWDQNSLCSTFVGTLQYIAPELFLQQSYARSVDYWSFGLVCHEIVTGFRPFLPSIDIPIWMKKVKCKTNDHICIYETVDGTIEYKTEIFPENHITQPLKYALEDWLRIALEWNGERRGKSHEDDSLIIFTTLEAALMKKIVTVYCVRKLERLSYEIDESTLISTLKQWIDRDTGIPVSSQLLLLPSGDSLEDTNKPIHPHLDNDPKLVAMLYVVSKQEGVRLPHIETLQSKHPPIVRRMLETPRGPFSFDVVRRMWANAVFFVQSVLESYRAFIEAYSVKMLSLIEFKKQKLLHLQINIATMLQKIRVIIELSKDSLKIDLECTEWNQFSSVVDSNKSQEWKSTCSIIERELRELHLIADNELPHVAPKLEQINKLQDFEEPGQAHCNKLAELLDQGSKLYGGLIRLPTEARKQDHDSSQMVDIIFQLWEVISDISDDEPFIQHLEEMANTDNDVNALINSLNCLDRKLITLQDRVKKSHLDRQRDIWNIAKCVSERCYSEINDQPPPLPRRPARISMDRHWHIQS